MGSANDTTSGGAGNGPKTAWFLWISLILWTGLSISAFPYADSSPRAILAVTGPLCVLLNVGVLVRFYWVRRQGLSRDSTE